MGFDIYEQIQYVNHNITINYNPENYSSYKLTIYKDNEIYSELTKEGPATITLTESGSYTISVFDGEKTINSGIYNIDKEMPILELKKDYIEIRLGDNINIREYTSATDGKTDISNKITYSDYDLKTTGIKRLNISVSDEAGNTVNKTMVINVLKKEPSIFILQTIFIIILSIIVIGILLYNKSVKLERHISRFSISPLKETGISLFDKISMIIHSTISRINKVLYKSEFLKKYSKKYKKYVSINNEINKTSMDFISTKFLCSFISVIIALFSKTMQLKVFRIYDIYLPLLFGFFIPDLIYYFKYKAHKIKMENDLLQAIIIMNNAFKSGRSIVQAIDLVAHELDGTMAKEFKKMYLELSFGLGLDVVFTRFYERIKIEEVAYLTASLTILNRSGGNIVEVFSSIEKSLFNKKKLRLELQSLTSGSRIIVRVLMIVPLAFILLISFVNPSYFIPLFSSDLGYLIMFMILILYIMYIILVRKLLKVKIWKIY